MSYVGFPRVHFAGAFFTNPGNLNNKVANYTSALDGGRLSYETGPYNNPNGVAQFYFYECKITQLIGADALPIASDPLLGAKIDTASPANPAATFAKIVDLDPDMMFRTELYGMRLYIEAPGGYGLSASVAVPQLRDLYFLRGNAGIQGLQVACGTWHQRVRVEQWRNPSGRSAALARLSASGATELDLKLTVDMFQTDPLQQQTSPIDYCYGRLMGTLGPVTPGMPRQIVPGRRLYVPPSTTLAMTPLARLQPKTREAAQVAASETSGAAPWNNTDARVVQAGGTSYLVVDFGTTTPLAEGGQGSFACGTGLTFGYSSNGQFVPFQSQGYTAGGKLVSISEQLSTLPPPEALEAHCNAVYYPNAGVVQLQLTQAEASAISSLPLCIQSDGATVLQENASGYYVNFEVASCRMSPQQTLDGGLSSANLVAYRFGQPVASITTFSGTAPSPGDDLAVQLTPLLYVYGSPNGPDPEPTPLFSASVATEALPGAPGQFQVTLTTGAAQPMASYPARKAMDSLLCAVDCATSPSGSVGENPAFGIPPVSLLFWQDGFVVSSPTWQANIGPILTQYARLYPGMAGILDLSDQPTVLANARSIVQRMSLPVADPGFMPVVRDMSPATSSMITGWLEQQLATASGGGKP